MEPSRHYEQPWRGDQHGRASQLLRQLRRSEVLDEEQLAALVSIIALINTYNRMNVLIKQPADDYQPGQLG